MGNNVPQPVAATTRQAVVTSNYDFDLEMDQTKEEIESWVNTSKNEENLVQYYLSLFLVPGANAADRQEHQKHFSTLAKLQLASDDAETLQYLYNIYYQWTLIHEEPLPTRVPTLNDTFSAIKTSDLLPEHLHGETRWVLQIYCNRDFQWHNWLYIKKSNIMTPEPDEWGLFSARHFPKGGIVGFYCGDRIWTASKPGTKWPKEDQLEDAGVMFDETYAVNMRDRMSRATIVAPDTPTDGHPSSLLLGMQYIKSAEENQNVKLEEDGSVKATEEIFEGHELYCQNC